ncbi:zinc transporter ZntB [Pseudoalteromonas tunicata]|jgi:zinc transporter|uniref:Putative transporter protein n=1 Tax=Pseudoalteromonas tunicata D2 TaxID=87626 RepID=A4C711_9GAMM|nr:zinc transporter ZntB [Pseudoalteromonas tunicata]ATC95734.1 zinc transporter [Pseudoalteromonas tunicata]AXT31289.1 zinc transporter ZntB [Pseudoalteromonas tunicata]EAR29765.1 putative transporter protein [Pseudoalteromonas tunicata D2]MDP4985670.1 zinc transporter ZntB [Pseudoalteromonas tunicata]
MKNQGLIHALLLDGAGGAKPLNAHEVRSWQPEQGQLWLHFDYGVEQSQDWIQQDLGLEPLVIDSLLAGETRPRAVKVASGCLLFLRGVNLNPAQTPEDMVSIRVYADENRIISTRRRRLLSVSQLHDQLMIAQGPCSISQIISQLALGLTSRMESVIDEVDDRLDVFESDLGVAANDNLHQALSKIRRQTITLKRYIKPQREGLKQFLSHQLVWFESEQVQVIEESINDLTRLIEELDMAIERAQIVYEEIANLISEQVNKRMYIMSVVAAIFLPLGFLTGLLGINVGGVPGTENPNAFFIFVALLVGLFVSLAGYFKYKGWI